MRAYKKSKTNLMERNNINCQGKKQPSNTIGRKKDTIWNYKIRHKKNCRYEEISVGKKKKCRHKA